MAKLQMFWYSRNSENVNRQEHTYIYMCIYTVYGFADIHYRFLTGFGCVIKQLNEKQDCFHNERNGSIEIVFFF